jgi:predicted TIM-barrel fold metal-dependent hydrolase
MEKLIIVSADGHAGPRVEGFTEYLEPKYRALMPELVEDEKTLLGMKGLFSFMQSPARLSVVDPEGRMESGAYQGSWDAQRRLSELDAEGIAAEIVYPGTAEGMTPFFYQFNRPYPAETRWAGVRAYHRWLADMITPSQGRLIGTAEPGPFLDMDETIRELRFTAEKGFGAVFVPGQTGSPALGPLFDRAYEPFWATCNELGLVLTIHVGWGVEQGEFTKILAEVKKLTAAQKPDENMGFEDGMMKVMSMLSEDNPDSMFALDLGPRQALWQIIFSGVFDRYPKLKLVVAECRADWVPGYKKHLDERFERAPDRPKLKLKPSEYFGRNVFIVPTSPRRHEVEQRHAIGLRNFLFGADFPHPEATWPNTLSWLRKVFFDVPEKELRAILGGNAIDVYGLDKAWLSAIANRIGHHPGDVIGDFSVNEQLIGDFNLRSGFSKTSPVFVGDAIDRKVDGDLGAAAR